MVIVNLKWVMMYYHRTLKLVVLIIVCSSMIMRLEGAAVQNGKCNVTMCGPTEIRFPFHLKHRDDHCVFPPGFQLSCVKNYGLYGDFSAPIVEFKFQVNTSLPGVYLSFSVKAFVASINYRKRQLQFVTLPESDSLSQPNFSTQDIRQDSYYPHNNSQYNYYLSNSPFKPDTLTVNQSTLKTYTRFNIDSAYYFKDYTFYNCSSQSVKIDINKFIKYVTSLNAHGYGVYAVPSHLSIADFNIKSCTKMYNISDVPYNIGRLTWSGPDCGHCEDKGQYCKFKPNSTTVTQCYPKGPPSHKLLVAGIVGGILSVLLTLVALCYATKSYIQKKSFQLRIETFLVDYKALKPSRYSYADIKKITNQFKVKLGEGGYGLVFKGKLSNEIDVAVKVLNDKVGANGSGEDFINEVSTIGSIHHVNVVRLVGYCADGCKRALVYEFVPNNSLEKFVFNKEFLGWEKMQDIALGIAKGIGYLHQGCAQPILHFDIKPNNILLDQNFNPKIADFGLAKLCTNGQSLVSMTMARGTVGYIAPEVFSRNFGKVSSKSDVYSFGMLLLEMVGARDYTTVETENTSETYFPECVFHHLEQGIKTSDQIEEEVNSNIARKLTIVGLWCINWHPADRPSMKQVIQMIQEEDCPAVPPNPYKAANSGNAFKFSNKLEVISELD